MALMYGMQRFVSYSQLGVNKSDTHGEVSKDVEFVQGNVDLGLLSLIPTLIESEAVAHPEEDGCSWGWCTWPREFSRRRRLESSQGTDAEQQPAAESPLPC